MTNLAEQSLGLDSGSPGPVTLQEKRQAYSDWLDSARKGNGPIYARARTDEGPSDPILAACREQAHADSAGKLLHDLPPGAIVRTDESDGTDADPSEEVRLKLAEALIAKMEGVDADTATRMANAGNALLAPLVVRADAAAADKAAADKKAADDKAADDANVKNRVLNDKAADDDKEFTLADVMTALGGFSKRLDAIEKGKDSEHTTTGPKDKKAADDAITDDAFRWRMKQDKLGTVTCSPDTQDAFAVVQSRADKVYSANGQQADKPLYGETLSAYRRRLLIPLQKYSDHFKNSDLRVVAVDPAAFNAVEDSIYKSAADAARDPRTVPLGFLREHVEQRGGHTYVTFTGRPASWMAQFAPSGKRIKRVNQHSNNGGPSKVLYGSP